GPGGCACGVGVGPPTVACGWGWGRSPHRRIAYWKSVGWEPSSLKPSPARVARPAVIAAAITAAVTGSSHLLIVALPIACRDGATLLPREPRSSIRHQFAATASPHGDTPVRLLPATALPTETRTSCRTG